MSVLARGTITRSLRDVLSITSDSVASSAAENRLLDRYARSHFVSSENTKTMTEADNQSVAPANSAPPMDLPEPHFDQTAVAAAHPVQPLPDERPRRRKRLAFIGLVGLVLIIATMTTLGFFIASWQRSDASAAPVADVPSATPAQAAQSQTGPGVQRSQTVSIPAKPRVERPSNSRAGRSLVIAEHGNPVARRVGVINYGHSHSSDQP